MDKKVGFYYNCYKNKYATDRILERLRLHYPTNPVFLISDKGDDFSDLANKYQCHYYYSNINMLGGKVIDGVHTHCFANEDSAKFFLQVIKLAIHTCDTEYLVLMEDDVLINGKIQHFPEHSGGAVHGNPFRQCTIVRDDAIIKETYPQMKFDFWNLAGGSIIHCNTIVECIDNTSFDEIKRFDDVSRECMLLWHTNDILLSYLLAIRGYTTEGWTNTKKSNIVHPYKEFYNKNLGIKEGVFRK